MVLGRMRQWEALRQEVRALRDTTMQYDLSFDAALERMESRVESIERAGTTGVTGSAASAANTVPLAAHNSYASSAASSSTYNDQTATLRAGR